MNSNSNPKQTVFNLPNQLTALRLILSVAVFCLISWEFYMVALVFFIIAAGTDWLDGYYARKYDQVTVLGRILDPFADKIIICGVFIFLVAVPVMAEVPWGLRPWMVVLVVARELLVTVLRSFIESTGGDFSAKTSGKLKMLFQCVAAGVCLFYLSYTDPIANAPGWCWALLVGSVYSAVVLTVYSGVIYIIAAARLTRG